MKYLKAFESSKLIPDPYYYSISMDVYDDISDGTIKFTQPEIDKLNDIFKEYDLYKLLGWGLAFRDLSEDKSFIIRKTEDEWYLFRKIIGMSSREYKCDQWEGLMKCIEDKTDLKLFESFEASSDKLYEKISKEQAILFSKDNQQLIISIKDFEIISRVLLKESIVLERPSSSRARAGLFGVLNNEDYLYLCLYQDEWWVLDVLSNNGYDVYYKCDQLEGLLECIHDKL